MPDVIKYLQHLSQDQTIDRVYEALVRLYFRSNCGKNFSGQVYDYKQIIETIQQIKNLEKSEEILEWINNQNHGQPKLDYALELGNIYKKRGKSSTRISKLYLKVYKENRNIEQNYKKIFSNIVDWLFPEVKN